MVIMLLFYIFIILLLFYFVLFSKCQTAVEIHMFSVSAHHKASNELI